MSVHLFLQVLEPYYLALDDLWNRLQTVNELITDTEVRLKGGRHLSTLVHRQQPTCTLLCASEKSMWSTGYALARH